MQVSLSSRNGMWELYNLYNSHIQQDSNICRKTQACQPQTLKNLEIHQKAEINTHNQMNLYVYILLQATKKPESHRKILRVGRPENKELE